MTTKIIVIKKKNEKILYDSFSIGHYYEYIYLCLDKWEPWFKVLPILYNQPSESEFVVQYKYSEKREEIYFK
jgi:hypothetical protein